MGFKDNSKSKNALYLILFAAVMLLFRFTWTGYYYVVAIIVLFLIIYGIYYLIKAKKDRLKHIKFGVVALVILLVLAFIVGPKTLL